MAKRNSAVRCAFCGGRGPFTAEHVFPEWAARLVGAGRFAVRSARLNEPVRRWQAVRSFGFTVRDVCQSCNNEWMSELETLAMPILQPMIRPVGSVTLDADQQLVLACWLSKVAILHEYAATRRYFRVADRASLLRRGAPPPGVQIWIGAYVGSRTGTLWGGPCTFAGGRPPQHVPGLLTTLNLGQFAAQLLAHRLRDSMRVRGQYDFSRLVLRIWPPLVERVTWPPAAGGLDDEAFSALHRRWNTPLLRP